MSDLTPVLQACLSNDNRVRTQAEGQLRAARQQNLALFLVTLVLILADEAKPSPARQMAGLQLKNELQARSEQRSQQLAHNWRSLAPELQDQIRQQVVKTLHSKLYEARKIASRVVASIASIDLYDGKWLNVIQLLQQNIIKPSSAFGIESSLMGLGFLCEICDARPLAQQSNAVMTAIFHGMRNDKNLNIKLAGVDALYNAIEFAEPNFKRPEHRTFIMNTILGCASCPDKRVRKSAMSCIVQVAFRYYPVVGYFLGPLTQTTLQCAAKDLDPVAMQAVEFWSTLAETEADIIDEIEEAEELGRKPRRRCFWFVKQKLQFLCPVLLPLLLKQTEDFDAWNIAAASGTCLSLVSHVVGDGIVKHVMPFIVANINNTDWHYREAAALAFAAIVDGPRSEIMENLVGQAIPHLLSRVKDSIPVVKDTAVFCLGRIAEFQPKPLVNKFLNPVVQALLFSMNDVPFIAEKAAWAMLNLAKVLEPDTKDAPTSLLSQFFQPVCEKLLQVTTRPDVHVANLRLNAYECLTTMITVSTPDTFPYLENRIADVLVQRLFQTIQQMNPGNHEQVGLVQGLVTGALNHVTQKLGPRIRKHADGMMRAFLTILGTKNVSTQHEVLMAIGTLATALGDDFVRYMGSFQRFLLQGLSAKQEHEVCIASVYCVIDIAFAIKKKMVRFTDDIVRILLTNLQAADIQRDIKPLVISAFGDIAFGIGADFQKYVFHVAAVLKNASMANVNRQDDEMVEYLNTLREHIFEAYSGILQGVKKENPSVFNPFVKPLIEFIGHIYSDRQTDQEVIVKACTAVGDLVNVYGPKCKEYINFPFVKSLIRECLASQDPDTRRAAMYAKREIKNKLETQ